MSFEPLIWEFLRWCMLLFIVVVLLLKLDIDKEARWLLEGYKLYSTKKIDDDIEFKKIKKQLMIAGRASLVIGVAFVLFYGVLILRRIFGS